MLTVVNLVALVESAGLVLRAWRSGEGLGVFTWFLIATWLLSNLLDLIPWYPGIREKRGIRIHFRKSLVPASYLAAIGLGGRWLGLSDWVLLPVDLLMLVLFYVNAMLIHLHLKDNSTLTPGFYSHNLHLRVEALDAKESS